MSVEILKEITNLLERVLVFDTKFKKEVLFKAKDLSEAKLNKLKSILQKVNEWQKEVLTKKIKEDPDFYNEIVSARKKLDQKIINFSKQKLKEEDRKKMEIILDKMKNL